MKQNIDDAFIRRLRFIVQFPFPDDHYRELIWQRVFPREAPLDTRVNFRWLAKQLKVSGGHIKNISLRAAFLAIERDGSIDMDCLITAARREAEKTGKIATLPDFRIPGERAVRLETAEVL
jgi:ATP-dependent 26S proteasome regulatory subunit